VAISSAAPAGVTFSIWDVASVIIWAAVLTAIYGDLLPHPPTIGPGRWGRIA
jgi:hypothetical protein